LQDKNKRRQGALTVLRTAAHRSASPSRRKSSLTLAGRLWRSLSALFDAASGNIARSGGTGVPPQRWLVAGLTCH